MEVEEQKVCPNCKREIPAVNFTIHSVHCARNIKVCPVCKEPVPHSELQGHHEKLHKLMPCKQCGEKVCGTDLEDHIRDSCGHTIKSCRFCDLELPRRELPAHEGYCGVRTEQCPECLEWVMIKYRQLHLDSNHGFLRLDDDPMPQQKKEPPKTINLPKTTNVPKPKNISKPKNTNLTSNQLRTEMRYYSPIQNGPSTSNSQETSRNEEWVVIPRSQNSASDVYQDAMPSVSRYQNSVQNDNLTSASRSSQNGHDGVANKKPSKRTNDQPQINTAVVAANKVEKNMAVSRGAVKKRPAPQPPADPKRDLAYYSALHRVQQEERIRQEQNLYNLAHGLPPVLSPAAKLEKLRKMDALHNREVQDTDYKSRLQGRVWMDRTTVPLDQTVGTGSSQEEEPDTEHLEVDTRPRGPPNSGNPDNEDDRRNDFRNVKPMTPEQFMDRFKELQLRKDGARSETSGDRFSEIKSSLRELRRGLNEVTAPYNSNNANVVNNGEGARSRPRSPAAGAGAGGGVRLPCEFCGAAVLAHDLVLHQTGCRPDLAQYRPSPGRSPSPLAFPQPLAPLEDQIDPVIPCEFCTESLPVYLISEHQERCGREANLLYPD